MVITGKMRILWYKLAVFLAHQTLNTISEGRKECAEADA